MQIELLLTRICSLKTEELIKKYICNKIYVIHKLLLFVILAFLITADINITKNIFLECYLIFTAFKI